MENLGYIKDLYSKYLNETLTTAEGEILFAFFEQASEEALGEVVSDFLDNGQVPEDLQHLNPDVERVFQQIARRTATVAVPLHHSRMWTKYIAVAAAIALITFGIIFYRSYDKAPFNSSPNYTNDIAPGKDRARLILANGQSIDLETIPYGKLADQSGITVSKTANGALLYGSSAEPSEVDAGKAAMNTIVVPKGGQYRLRLSDGSTVQLNSASSLKFPVIFSGETRLVQLTGEAYFEVQKGSQAFIVQTATQQVEVLGTHFNVKSYDDEGKTVTTLAEGKVKVSGNKNTNPAYLTAGEQAINAQGSIHVQAADMETALAWKNNRIYFKEATIKEVLLQASRWYDFEVEYRGKMSTERFTGAINRSSKLSALLKVLEMSGAKFIIQQTANRKILIVE